MALSTDEARRMVAAAEVAVVDLRDDEAWIASHIPGAHHASEDDLESVLEELPDDRKILVVCEDGKRSAEVAERLGEGDREALSLAGGMNAWDADHLPQQPSSDPG